MGCKEGLTALAATIALAACNTSGCLDNRSALPLAEFRSSATDAAIYVDSLEVAGVDAPEGAVLSEFTTRKSQLYLPMRSTASSTAWRFIYRQKALDFEELIDTVAFHYASIPYFASEECGATYRYRVERVATTHHLIDSVVMADSLITNVDKVSVLVYFRTSTGEGGGEQ